MFLTREQRPFNEKSQSFQLAMEKLAIYMKKNEVVPLPNTIHKKQLKMDQRPKSKT